jgi:ABC-type transport system involved in multi-copper enzyme maturation permease subunit
MRILTLVIHTFRETAAKATLWVLAGISTLILLVVGLGLSTGSSADGVVLMFFGNPTTPPLDHAHLEQAVAVMEAGLAGGLMLGVFLFGLFATAGIIPETLEKGIVDLYLSKPIARWELLAGKSLGAIAMVLANIVYFIGAVWVLVGVKAGVWDIQFLAMSLLLAFVFACLYSIVAFFAVLSRNMGLAIIAAFLYLFIISSVLDGRAHGLYMISDNSVYRGIIDGLYYILPQLTTMQHQITAVILKQEADWRPFAQSLASSCAIFGAAAALLQRKDF